MMNELIENHAFMRRCCRSLIFNVNLSCIIATRSAHTRTGRRKVQQLQGFHQSLQLRKVLTELDPEVMGISKGGNANVVATFLNDVVATFLNVVSMLKGENRRIT